MKNNKINKIIAILLVIILMIISSANLVYAETSLKDNELLIINGKTILKNATINQVNSMLGKPKIETISAFGGKAYSYYDDNYSYYLFLETDENGVIKSYGAIGGNFKGKRYGQGDTGNSTYWFLSGESLYDYFGDKKVYGIMEYNCTYSDEEKYWTNYEKRSGDYLYALQPHCIAVSKALAVKNGDPFKQTYATEDLFYMNEQLKYNGMSLVDYAENMGIETQIRSTGRSYGNLFYEYLPNPISYGSSTEKRTYESNYKYIIYDVQMTDFESKKHNYGSFYVDPSFLENRKTVELTADEKQKLSSAVAKYKEYLKNLEATNNGELVEIKPQVDKLPLTAGKYKKQVLQTITDWLNVARLGIGMGALELDTDIADCAQHKAALVYYMNQHGMDGGHFPEQPEGVSDEFYQKAQSYMNENLFTGTIQTSIPYALNDGYGDPVSCGHRYNLIDPYYTKWGLGTVGEGLSIQQQSAHKFAGNTKWDGELVAWPSNGILPLELVYIGIGNWTAQFYKNYEITDKTTVTVKCLNTDKVYDITATDSSNGKFLAKTGKDLITFRDDSITYQDGDVFEITLHNVKNSAGGLVEYKYRSVFKQFSSSAINPVTDVSLDKTSVLLSIGQSQRVLAKAIPDEAKNKLMTFTSSNKDVATVRQDGTITGVSKGKTTITVKCGNITKTIQVEVTDKIQGDVNGDGDVTLADCTKILKHVKKTQYLTGEELQRADINGKDGITLADYTILLKFVKKVAPLP